MINSRLKEERTRLGLTQPIFAEYALAKKRTVQDWEKGTSSPTAVQLEALSKVGVDVSYVITGKSSSGFNHNYHKRAIDILVKYLAISERELTHPEMFYPISMEIYKVIEKAESQGNEVDQTEIGAKIISLFAA